MTQGLVTIESSPAIGDHVWPEHCRAVLAATIHETCRHFPAAGPSADDIHSARRGLKKSYAVALLLHETIAESCDAAIAVFERVRKCLGVARDFDVMGDVLGLLAPELDPAFAAKLAALLAAEKNGHVALAALNPRNLCEDLQRQAALVDQWSLVHADAASTARAARRTYKRALNRGLVALERDDPEELHVLRKAVVAFRYQMDALAPAWPKLFHATVAEAQQLRTCLGEHHDLATLAAFVASHEELQDGQATFSRSVAGHQARLAHRARSSFARLFGERPKAFERRLLACLEHPKRTIRWNGSARASRRRA